MGACNYFSAQVSHLHGGAQLESCKYKKYNVSAMYGHGGRDSGCGSGHRCFGGHGRFRGCGGGSHSGGRGGRGSGNSTMINGVDVLDPTHAFTEEEWGQLAWNGGCQYVTQARERINGRGGHGSCHGGRDGRGGGHSTGGNHNASSIESDRNGEQPDASTGQQQQSGNGDCGAQHGCGFGRGVLTSIIDSLGCWHCLLGLYMDWSIGIVSV